MQRERLITILSVIGITPIKKESNSMHDKFVCQHKNKIHFVLKSGQRHSSRTFYIYKDLVRLEHAKKSQSVFCVESIESVHDKNPDRLKPQEYISIEDLRHNEPEEEKEQWQVAHEKEYAHNEKISFYFLVWESLNSADKDHSSYYLIPEVEINNVCHKMLTKCHGHRIDDDTGGVETGDELIKLQNIVSGEWGRYCITNELSKLRNANVLQIFVSGIVL